MKTLVSGSFTIYAGFAMLYSHNNEARTYKRCGRNMI